MTAFILTAFLIVAGADSITTYQAMQRGAREANPILRTLGVNRPLGVAVVSFSISLGAAAVIGNAPPAKRKPVLIALAVITVLRGWVAWHNTQVQRHK